MKKYILILAGSLLASFAFSQSNTEEVDLLQAAFGRDKKEMVAYFVNPSDAQKEAFWTLYDEYEAERKVLGKQRIQLLKQYAEQYQTLTGEQADEWTKSVMALQGKTNKLITTYYKKIKAVSDGIVATQFYQIENYILTGVRMIILEEIPFVQK